MKEKAQTQWSLTSQIIFLSYYKEVLFMHLENAVGSRSQIYSNYYEAMMYKTSDQDNGVKQPGNRTGHYKNSKVRSSTEHLIPYDNSLLLLSGGLPSGPGPGFVLA